MENEANTASMERRKSIGTCARKCKGKKANAYRACVRSCMRK